LRKHAASKQREAHQQRRQANKLKNILHFLLSFLELDKGAAFPPVIFHPFLWQHQRIPNERLKKKRPRQGTFWQMPCPCAKWQVSCIFSPL
jgi:hypothetical protein